ncbi:MAG: glycine zipper domain-containing protein [Candidatus Moraniibacteriota bacterium]
MKKIFFSLCLFCLLCSGCARGYNAQYGALLGAGAGALSGQALGHDTESTLLGTAIGAGAGFMAGDAMDKREIYRAINHLNRRR